MVEPHCRGLGQEEGGVTGFTTPCLLWSLQPVVNLRCSVFLVMKRRCALLWKTDMIHSECFTNDQAKERKKLNQQQLLNSDLD